MEMSIPRIVAIETSSRRGSIAVAEGPRQIRTAPLACDLPRGVSRGPAIAGHWQEPGWAPDSSSFLLVSLGPGSCPGLRVAVTAVRHLALATGARIVAVPSLAVVADNLRAATPTAEH